MSKARAKVVTGVTIKGKGKVKVNVKKNGALNQLRRFVKSQGIIKGDELAVQLGVDGETLNHIMSGLRKILRAGYEVRIEDAEDSGIRLFHGVHKDGTVFVVGQAIGKFRDCVYDLEFDAVRNGREVGKEELIGMTDNSSKQASERRRMLACITPDTVVNCPKCGTAIRIGKYLADNK